MALVASIVGACTSSSGDPDAGPATVTQTVLATPSDPATTSKAPTPTDSPTKPKGPVKTVHVRSLIGDGDVYGVGMPIILKMQPAPTDSTAFTKAVTVTVNEEPATGAWFWEQPLHSEKTKGIIEAHYRMKNFWPPNSTIQVKLPIKGLSAGKTKHGTSLVYGGKLTSITFRTGDKHVTTVDGRTETMKVLSNDKLVKTIPVSLGEAKTPTYTGTKIIMQKGADFPGTNKMRPKGAVRMHGPGYDMIVDWSVRLTNSGEYIHSAGWNSQIGQTSTSNGCTNLHPKDAKWYYKFSRVGDVTIYSHTTKGGGETMPYWDGYGDWNIPWNVWKQGKLLRNH